MIEMEHPWHAKLGDRSLFPQLAANVYLSHAAISPPSLPVQYAVQKLITDYAQDGVDAFFPWLEQRSRLRSLLATLLGTMATNIAFIPNTTSGVIAIAMCFPWQRGDRIVLLHGDFPANITPWQRAAELFQLQISFLTLTDEQHQHEQALEQLETILRQGVRLVAVSAVQFQTGLRMPLRAMASLCHRFGAQLFVDGIQACGVIPLQVEAEGIDYLSCGTHKWLMGVEGAGFLYVAQGRAEELRPNIAGWLSHEEGGIDFLFKGGDHLRYDRPIRRNATFLEVGTVNGVGLAALEASLTLLLELGIHAIEHHVQQYLDRLETALLQRGFTSLRTKFLQGRSGILSVYPPSGWDLLALHRALHQQGIICSVPDGRLRFAPHWPNAQSEIEYILRHLDRIDRISL